MSFTQRNKECIRKIILSLTPKQPLSNLLHSEFDDSVVAQRPRTTLNLKQRTMLMSQQRQELIQEYKRDRVKNKIKETIRHRYSRLCLLGAQEKQAIILRLENKPKSHSSSLVTPKNTSPSNVLRQSRLRLRQSQSTIEKFLNNSLRAGPCEVSGQKLNFSKKVKNSPNSKITHTKSCGEGQRYKKLFINYRQQKRKSNPEIQVQRIEPWGNEQDFELRGPIYNRRRLQMN